MRGKKVNVAVVGLGFMGVTHVRAYQRLHNARVSAACDHSRIPVGGVLGGVDGNLGDSSAVQVGENVRFYRRYEELLLDPEIEVVDICTPTSLHLQHALAALQAGKHVICEKPLAENVADTRRLLTAAERSGKFLMPAMCMRFWPGWMELKNIVQKKSYGAVLTAGFRRLSARPTWSKQGTHTGGALYDLHIHDADFVNFLFGRPQKVFSTGLQDKGGNIDHVVTQYYYEDGPVVHAEGSWLLNEGFNMSYSVQCERATLDFDLSRGAGALQIQRNGKIQRVLKPSSADGYNGEIRYFVNCIARGVPPAAVTGRDFLTAMEILAAEETSVRTGNLVAL